MTEPKPTPEPAGRPALRRAPEVIVMRVTARGGIHDGQPAADVKRV